MNIVIAGSTGYLGTKMKEFLEKENSVKILDLRNVDKINILNADVFINCVGKTPDNGKFSYQEYYESNVETVKKLFEIFIDSKAKKLIHFSSISAVEELSSEEILTEEDFPNPVSDYGKTKRLAEEFLLSQKTSENQEIIILRPTRIHGEKDKGTILQLYNFVKKIPYPFGAYDNKRSFLYIENLLYLVKKIILSDEIKPGIYNINDDEAVSTIDIIKIIEKSEHSKLRILKISKKTLNLLAKIGDFIKFPFNTIVLKKITTTRVVSNEKLKKALGIENLPISAEEGLIKTIKSFR